MRSPYNFNQVYCPTTVGFGVKLARTDPRMQFWGVSLLGCEINSHASLRLRACLSVRFQGFTPTPQYRPSATGRLWPASPASTGLALGNEAIERGLGRPPAGSFGAHRVCPS